MLKVAAIGLTIFFAALTANAGTDVTQQKKIDGLAECIAAVTKTGNSLVFDMGNGSSVEFVKGQNTRFSKAAITDAGGHKSEYFPADMKPVERVEVPNFVARDENYIKLHARIKAAFKKMVRKECNVFALRVAKGNSKNSDTVVTNGLGSYDTMEPGTGWSEDDFYVFADEFISDDQSSGRGSWLEYAFIEYAARDNQLPSCTVIVADCKGSCASLQTYETAGCGALGGIAGIALSPGIGIAVGFYCSGKVFVAAEECKAGCNSPPQSCN